MGKGGIGERSRKLFAGNGSVNARLVEPYTEANQAFSAMPHVPFSESGADMLQAKVDAYRGELVREAGRIAKYHQADVVSAGDIERANENVLAEPRRKIYRHLGTLGGIMLGVAGSNLMNIITAQSYTMLGLLLTFVLGVLGTLLLGIHFARE